MSVRGGAPVRVRLLGHPELACAGRAVTLATRKAVVLLARLAAEGPQTRELLTALLWPDADEDRGRANLRRTLAYVRDGFGRDVEVVTGSTGSLALAAGVETDLDAVRGALRPPLDAGRLATALAAWRGEFLDGVQVDGEVLDGWLSQQRESWHQRLALAAEQLVSLRSRAGDVTGALAIVDAWLGRDALAEAAHRERIRLHLVRGDRPAALDAYRRCAELLDRELGVQPSPATEELGRRAQRGNRPTDLAPGREESRPEVPMLGREREHAALASALDRAAGGAPALALVPGEAGIGKSRLVAEFGAWAAAQGVEVRLARAFPSGRRLAYQAVAGVLDEVLSGDATAGFSGRDDLRLFQAAAHHLVAITERRPLVLVVDDLHWVDADSLEMLLFALATLADRAARILVVVTVRDDEVAGSTTLRDWVARAAREVHLTEIPLRPLSPSESARLVELWPEPVDDRAGELADRTGGRPLLIVESLRYLAAGGDAESIAPAVRESMQARLRSLSPDGRRLADAAAVLEKPATVPLLSAVAGLDASAAALALDGLLHRHVLAGDGIYSFSHEMLRQAAYAAIPAEARRALHAQCTRALLATGAGAAGEAARHAELAGDLEVAWDLHRQAAARAMALPAYRVAAGH